MNNLSRLLHRYFPDADCYYITLKTISQLFFAIVAAKYRKKFIKGLIYPSNYIIILQIKIFSEPKWTEFR